MSSDQTQRKSSGLAAYYRISAESPDDFCDGKFFSAARLTTHSPFTSDKPAEGNTAQHGSFSCSIKNRSREVVADDRQR